MTVPAAIRVTDCRSAPPAAAVQRRVCTLSQDGLGIGLRLRQTAPRPLTYRPPQGRAGEPERERERENQPPALPCESGTLSHDAGEPQGQDRAGAGSIRVIRVNGASIQGAATALIRVDSRRCYGALSTRVNGRWARRGRTETICRPTGSAGGLSESHHDRRSLVTRIFCHPTRTPSCPS